jgi:hypothetical protein
MTTKIYQTAIERAKQDGVQVIEVGAHYATVYSPVSIKAYTVTFNAEAMDCDCAAHGYCKHRAAVREYLVTSLAAVRLAQAAQLIDDAAAKVQQVEAEWRSYSNCCGNDADRGW